MRCVVCDGKVLVGGGVFIVTKTITPLIGGTDKYNWNSVSTTRFPYCKDHRNDALKELELKEEKS